MPGLCRKIRQPAIRRNVREYDKKAGSKQHQRRAKYATTSRQRVFTTVVALSIHCRCTVVAEALRWVDGPSGREWLSGEWRCVSAFESARKEVLKGLLESGDISEWHQDDGAWGLSMCPVSEPVGLRRFSGFSLAPGFIPVILDEYTIEPIHGFFR